MYSHILGRAADYPEMKRIIEPPMHVDSQLSSNIQFADWVAACVTRAIEYQLIKDSPYKWVATCKELNAVRGGFTSESKIHVWKRDLADLDHTEIFRDERPLYPKAAGHLIGDRNPEVFHKIKAAAERASARQTTQSG
ncbi:hypothetical protein LRC484719_16020 [Mycobacterium riyadhense]